MLTWLRTGGDNDCGGVSGISGDSLMNGMSDDDGDDRKVAVVSLNISPLSRETLSSSLSSASPTALFTSEEWKDIRISINIKWKKKK